MNQQSSDREFNIGLGSMAAGIVLGTIGLVFILWFGQRTSLNCNRRKEAPETCTLRRSLLFIPFYTRTIPLEQMRSASLELGQCVPSKVVHARSGITRCTKTYRVILATSEASIPLTTDSPHTEKTGEAIADRINQFLRSPVKSSVKVKIGPYLGPYLTGFIFIGLGAFFVYGGWWQMKDSLQSVE